MATKTCFVVMGFGEKTDYQTQRTLNLDKTYQGIIKPAVEESGLTCIRADDIIHSGVIDKPMYEHLLDADLVIADLSTANPNAIYELGVRHALRPNTTIILAEDQFKFPFDLASVLIRTYEHLGKGIDFEEVEKLRAELKAAIKELVFENKKIDSPVYTFLHDLQQPVLNDGASSDTSVMQLSAEVADDNPGQIGDDIKFSVLLETAQEAIEKSEFEKAKLLFQKCHQMNPADAYIVQQLALATYKSPQADDASRIKALIEAKDIIENSLKPLATNDPETLGLWGAVHKRLWELNKNPVDLDTAVWAYERGFYLKRDYYNGINYAFILNQRALLHDEPDEAIADRVIAKRVRKQVIDLVTEAEQKLPRNKDQQSVDAEEAYWLAATRLEALLGLGEFELLEEESKRIYATAPATWMPDSTREQLDKLKNIL
jgi:hypothetical protein